MPMILLVVVGSINQSNSVGLCESTWGLCGGLCGDFLKRRWGKNQDFMLIRQ